MGGECICVCGVLKPLLCWRYIVVSFRLLLNRVTDGVFVFPHVIRSNQDTVTSYPRKYSIASSPALLVGIYITFKSTDDISNCMMFGDLN